MSYWSKKKINPRHSEDGVNGLSKPKPRVHRLIPYACSQRHMSSPQFMFGAVKETSVRIRQLLPIFVLAIGGLGPLGCGSQRQVASNLVQGPNETLNRLDSVNSTSDVAAVPGLRLVGDAASYTAQEHTAPLVLLNSRQRVLSSGFSGRDY
jgi:hypothetical protein